MPSPQSEKNRSTGGTPWVAFLAGIILVAVVAFGVITYTGGLQETPSEQVQIPPAE